MWFFLIVVIFCMCHDFSLEFYIAIWIILGVLCAWGFWIGVRQGLDELRENKENNEE